MKDYRTKINALLIEKKMAEKQAEEESQALVDCIDQLETIGRAQQILQELAQTIQTKAHERISSIVTKCLETIFDDPYTFKINFVKKRGKTEADLIFERDGFEIDPKTASGGGVLDVASFALRLSCLVLSRPLQRKVVIADEPFKYVSEEYRTRIRAMLLGLAKDLGVQFVQVTHIKELKIGEVVEI